MTLTIPDRGVNLANHEQGHRIAQQVTLWIMAQGRPPTQDEYFLCDRLSAYALDMVDTCWIRRRDYETLMARDQPGHQPGRRINHDTRRFHVAEFLHWFRQAYTQENPEFLFEILDV